MSNNEKAKRRWRTAASTQIRARQLRQEQTSAEEKPWQHLRDRQLDGVKFRRQHPIGRFIVDFYCAEQRLIIEIDGAVHKDQSDRDIARTEALQAAGYTVIRYSNSDVEQHIEAILLNLRHALTSDDQPSPAND